MFKKLKDKIAEEVKSSPQRIQQFAQAAQAAVTSASSSISDISNNDLFSIADDETPQNSPHRPVAARTSGFQDVSLVSTPSPLRSADETKDSLSPLSLTNHHHPSGGSSPPGAADGAIHNTAIYPPPSGASRLRKLSNSSNASDVSFRLPSYESPGAMYHLQSDLDVSESEMEGGASIPTQLEKVSKEQLFAAYRRSNEKYNKYRGRYTDLARHYRNLERENAKARAVLVETQDKALRRISELREQCSLEQSAKAHLESALRMELDERSLKIESLNTKIKLLQSYGGQNTDSKADPAHDATIEVVSAKLQQGSQSAPSNGESLSSDQQKPLIDFSSDHREATEAEQPTSSEELEIKHSSEILRLNDKIQKLDQLVVKCKETIKTHKEKNSQLGTELQIASTQLEKKKAETEQLESKVSQMESISNQLTQSRDQQRILKEELESFEKRKASDILAVQKDLDLAKLEIASLMGKVDILSKREEENVISLAENKLSVHKELESKEKEIKILKDNINSTNAKVKSNEAIIENLKTEVKDLEQDRLKMSEQLANFDAAKEQVGNLQGKLNELRSHNTNVESKCSSLSENMKCTELQLKQEVSEKMAVIDRNNFLEGRNKHLGDENAKKNKQIADLEKEIIDMNKSSDAKDDLTVKYEDLLKEKIILKSEIDGILGSKETLENELNSVTSKCKDFENKLELLCAENSALKTQLEAFTHQVESLQAEKETVENLLKNATGDVEKSKLDYSRSIEELRAKITELEHQAVHASQSNETQESIQQLHNEMKLQMEEKEGDMIKSYEEKVSDFEDLKMKYNVLSAMCKDLNHKQSESVELASSYDKLKATYNDLIDKQSEYEEKLSSYEELQVQYKHLNDQQAGSEEVSSNYEKLKELHEVLINKQIECDANLTSISDEISQLKRDKEELLRENNELISKIESRASESDKLKSDCEILQLDKCKLEEKVASLNSENTTIKARTEALVADFKLLQEEIIVVQKSHSQIVSQKNLIEEKISLMEKSDSSKRVEVDELINQHIAENEELKYKTAELQSQIEKLTQEKSKLASDLTESRSVFDANEIKLKEFAENSEVWNVKLSNILDENNSLQEKCTRLRQEKESVTEKVTGLECKIMEFELMKTQYEESKLEAEFLNMRVSQLENDFSQASSDKNKYITEKEALRKELAHLTNTKKSEIDSLKEDLAKLKADLKMLHEERNSLQSQKDKEHSEKSQLIAQLQTYEEKVKINDTLELEKKKLEARLAEVQEKYRNVESSTNEELSNLQDANSVLRNKCEKLELKCSDFDSLTQSFASLESDSERMIVKIKVLEKIEFEHKAMLEESHALKSEKNKLQADIEGLQAHLTKVSKDNSQLNDKIRELEANGEVMQISYQQNLGSSPPDTEKMQSQLTKLSEVNSQLIEDLKTNENLSSKILDLERQNSILIEEKLELQDQINSSMDRHDRIIVGGATNSDNDYELNSLRTQLRDIINEKMDLEGRLADVELISRSGDSNLKALEQRNDKLRTTNEKLERRLDEALVSLNHIRTMEENTELEYLRNILYEYLTGPSNNNMVLAKVLAAVVKFDQRQTQLVMEREKEKQGVLGQLGLL